MSEDDIDAYIVVFSVNDRETFEMAVEILFQIRHELCSEKAVILVANKIDIVRKRVISSDGMWTTKQRYGFRGESCKGLEKTDLLLKNANFWPQDFPSLHANVINTATAIAVKVLAGWLKILRGIDVS